MLNLYLKTQKIIKIGLTDKSEISRETDRKLPFLIQNSTYLKIFSSIEYTNFFTFCFIFKIFTLEKSQQKKVVFDVIYVLYKCKMF